MAFYVAGSSPRPCLGRVLPYVEEDDAQNVAASELGEMISLMPLLFMGLSCLTNRVVDAKIWKPLKSPCNVKLCLLIG